jgi:hypothetical protein
MNHTNAIQVVSFVLNARGNLNLSPSKSFQLRYAPINSFQNYAAIAYKPVFILDRDMYKDLIRYKFDTMIAFNANRGLNFLRLYSRRKHKKATNNQKLHLAK